MKRLTYIFWMYHIYLWLFVTLQGGFSLEILEGDTVMYTLTGAVDTFILADKPELVYCCISCYNKIHIIL